MYHNFNYEGWVSKPKISDYNNTKVNRQFRKRIRAA